MAAPFGRMPTVGQYMAWLRECGGHCQSGFIAGDGLTVGVVRFTTYEGQSVVLADIEQDERLVPSLIAYLDRRLGVVSPWHVER